MVTIRCSNISTDLIQKDRLPDDAMKMVKVSFSALVFFARQLFGAFFDYCSFEKTLIHWNGAKSQTALS
jgi:hypothetical protein